MTKPQAKSLGTLGWIAIAPVLYYLSIFPVILIINLCFEDFSHTPGPIVSAVSYFYYPWGLLADAVPVLGLPLEFFDNLVR